MTLQECVAAARQRFNERNPSLLKAYELEGEQMADALGVSIEAFVSEQMRKQFELNAIALAGDVIEFVIASEAIDAAHAKELRLAWFEQVAGACGQSLEDYLSSNRIDDQALSRLL